MSKTYPAHEAEKVYLGKVKKGVLSLELDKVERKLRKKASFCSVRRDYTSVNPDGTMKRSIVRGPNLDKQVEYQWLLTSNHLLAYGLRLNHSKDARTYRLRERCTIAIESGKAVFGTLTFDDETLAKTNAQTRRKYVERFLKEQFPFYVANIDFGDNEEYVGDDGKARFGTEREHYHFLVVGHVDRKKWKYSKVMNFESVKKTKKGVKAIPKYIAKLTNHAIKDSGRGVRIIYSKNREAAK